MVELVLTQVVLCIVNTYLAFTENKKGIYVCTFLFNACNLIMYIFNGDKVTTLVYICITLRSLIYIFKDKIKRDVVPVTCIVIQFGVSLLTFESVWNTLTLCAAVWSCWYLWYFKDTQKLRVGNAINNTLWLFYNLYSGLWIASIARLFTVSINLFRYVQQRFRLSIGG